MSQDEYIGLIYNYSKFACQHTYIDYRDLAHMVFINTFQKYLDGEIKYIRSYLYNTVKNTFIKIIKTSSDIVELKENYIKSRNMDVDFGLDVISFCEKLKKCNKLKAREYFIFDQLYNGYNRKEIAKKVGVNIYTLNLIWFRIIKKIRRFAKQNEI